MSPMIMMPVTWSETTFSDSEFSNVLVYEVVLSALEAELLIMILEKTL